MTIANPTVSLAPLAGSNNGLNLNWAAALFSERPIRPIQRGWKSS